MRCYACNKVLSSFEATRRSEATGDFLDLCNHCYSTIKSDVPALERYDLADGDDLEDTTEDDEDGFVEVD